MQLHCQFNARYQKNLTNACVTVFAGLNQVSASLNRFKPHVWQKQVFAGRNPTLVFTIFSLVGLMWAWVLGNMRSLRLTPKLTLSVTITIYYPCGQTHKTQMHRMHQHPPDNPVGLKIEIHQNLRNPVPIN